MRLTLQEAQDALYESVVIDVDSQQNIDKFTKYLNLVQERYINSGKWNGMVQKVRIAVTNRYITLPRNLLSALAFNFEKGHCRWTGIIRNFWYDYQPHNCGNKLYDPLMWSGWGYSGAGLTDLGDGFVTYADSPYDSYYLKFVTEDSTDAGRTIHVKGVDPDNRQIWSDDGSNSYEGLKVTLVNGAVTTSQEFGHQVNFIEKSVTQGYVQLFAVDTVTAEETQIGVYQPGETNICYRRYRLPCRAEERIDAVSIIAKLRYVAASAPTDEVWPANLGALRNGLQALLYEKQGDKDRYFQYFQDGLKLLNDEMAESRGGARAEIVIDNNAFQCWSVNQGY